MTDKPAQLPTRFIDKYSPEIGAVARAALSYAVGAALAVIGRQSFDRGQVTAFTAQ